MKHCLNQGDGNQEVANPEAEKFQGTKVARTAATVPIYVNWQYRSSPCNFGVWGLLNLTVGNLLVTVSLVELLRETDKSKLNEFKNVVQITEHQ
jgi:hypothetical protein